MKFKELPFRAPQKDRDKDRSRQVFEAAEKTLETKAKEREKAEAELLAIKNILLDRISAPNTDVLTTEEEDGATKVYISGGGIYSTFIIEAGQIIRQKIQSVADMPTYNDQRVHEERIGILTAYLASSTDVSSQEEMDV